MMYKLNQMEMRKMLTYSTELSGINKLVDLQDTQHSISKLE